MPIEDMRTVAEVMLNASVNCCFCSPRAQCSIFHLLTRIYTMIFVCSILGLVCAHVSCVHVRVLYLQLMAEIDELTTPGQGSCSSQQSQAMPKLRGTEKRNILHRDDPLYMAENASQQVCKEDMKGAFWGDRLWCFVIRVCCVAWSVVFINLS